MEKAFDRKRLKHIEQNAKYMTDAHFNHCVYKCNEVAQGDDAGCKQSCFDNVIVPYKMVMHQAHSGEENLYKKCLAEKFPDIKQADYIECTKNVYTQRVEMMMNYFVNTSEKILADIH